MLLRKIKNRLKIPNRIAAMAAIMLLMSSFVDSTHLTTNATQSSVEQNVTVSNADEAVTDLVTVAVTAAKPASINISSLIFRF